MKNQQTNMNPLQLKRSRKSKALKILGQVDIALAVILFFGAIIVLGFMKGQWVEALALILISFLMGVIGIMLVVYAIIILPVIELRKHTEEMFSDVEGMFENFDFNSGMDIKLIEDDCEEYIEE